MTQQTADDLVVSNNPEQSRFEAWLDGELVGFSQYHFSGDFIIFAHTEVNPDYGGRGIGKKMVQNALAEVRAEGNHKIMATCPFVKTLI